MAIGGDGKEPGSGHGLRVLLVYCHPRQDSFCAAVRNCCIAALEQAGHVVDLLDLYDRAFSPVLEAEEHRRYPDPAANRQGIEEYVAPLQAADALLLIYPTWWYGLPAMLKGWLDRVWVPGVAFRLSPGAIQPLLTSIHRIGVVTTYGSPNFALVHWLAGPAYDRPRSEAALRPALPT